MFSLGVPLKLTTFLRGHFMFNGIYSTASALQANQEAHANVAANLAHLNVPGFRRHLNVFESNKQDVENPPVAGGDQRSLNGVKLLDTKTDFTPGPIRPTGRTLDVAIDGDGFLEIEGPDGPLYTRNGTLHIGTDGSLVTASGQTINGDGGPITIPEDVTPGQISIARDGTISARANVLGKLKVVSFEENGTLERAGTTLFRKGEGTVDKPSEASFQQGSLEMANTSSVDELISMMVGSRHFEASQRAMRSISEAIQQHTSPRS